MSEFIPQATIDFHKFGLLSEYDVEQKLANFLEDAYIQNLTQVLVITGKGEMVRPLVKKLLEKSDLVESFETAGYFNGQTGAFEVRISAS